MSAIGVPYWFMSPFASHMILPGGSASTVCIRFSYSDHDCLPS